MTVRDLIDELEGMPEDAIVQLALQPSYPMKGSIQNLCVQNKANGRKVLWIACSDNEDYGVPSGVWDDWKITDKPDDDE